MSNQDQEIPQPSDWERDGVGISDGNIIIKGEDGSGLNFCFKRQYLIELYERLNKLEHEKFLVDQQLNCAQPSRVIPDAITELLKRGTESDKFRADTMAGRVMAGQAQAYRDSAALLMGLIK